MVEGSVGRDSRRVQLIDEAAIVVETFCVGTSAAGGKNARPSDGEAIAAKSELPHERDVLGVSVVMIAGDIARVAVDCLARSMAEVVPDRWSATTLSDGPLDLIGRGRSSPHPTFRKDHFCSSHAQSIADDLGQAARPTAW